MGGVLGEGENAVLSGVAADVVLEPVPADEVVSGSPVQGVCEFDMSGGVEAGIWELRGGVVTDTEVDELFVVLSGAAEVELVEGPGVIPGTTVRLRPGDVMRLVAGTRTRWSVTDHIRKVYFSL